MRFLADENFPGDAVSALRAAGHDVSSVSERSPGARDVDVLVMAETELRILLTFDKDFGELAWNAGLPASCGIMLFRMPTPPAASIEEALLARIEERSDWAGHFSVIETGRVRMRSLRPA
ncbi:DUF5615 family PIN-like protein [Methylosinus sporium]|uniref:DUF5615 domain-containing protein n=1 Tax=Methylosinus sporium TaxID=428 RepID=A0A2U1SRQ5_METSR|nr:DUF5615 family PIN-like protein [Methylosinus sporium]PWB94291.1 hypothetical protein C5689_08155 [Methylosinus sporium]